MTLPVKSLIGLISSNSSRSPLAMNQRNESSCSSIRFGMGRTSGMRAYEMRAEAFVARGDDSADSMNRSYRRRMGKRGRARITERVAYRDSASCQTGRRRIRLHRIVRGEWSGRQLAGRADPRVVGLLDLDLGAYLFEGGLDLL